jgi:hypothetical protein
MGVTIKEPVRKWTSSSASAYTPHFNTATQAPAGVVARVTLTTADRACGPALPGALLGSAGRVSPCALASHPASAREVVPVADIGYVSHA